MSSEGDSYVEMCQEVMDLPAVRGLSCDEWNVWFRIIWYRRTFPGTDRRRDGRIPSLEHAAKETGLSLDLLKRIMPALCRRRLVARAGAQSYRVPTMRQLVRRLSAKGVTV